LPGIKINFVKDAQVVAVAAREQKSAQEFANKFNIPKAYGSYEELVSDPEVEIVYVNVIHPHHKHGVSLALNHGKHVLCEKPFTINAKDTQDLIQLAKEKQLFLMEAFWTRFFPATKKVLFTQFDANNQICDLIQQKAIGDVIGVQSNFGFSNSSAPRLNDPKLGGGALLDIGIYLVSFASMAFSGAVPTQILATGDLLPTGVDGHGAISLHYGTNQLASLLYSFKGNFPCNTVILGTEGYIKLDNHFWCPLKVTLVKGEEEKVFEFSIPGKAV
jgi:dihydrodiol dehydrogenase / D-xylose 1-dehydrogenase (NADP)